MELFVLFRRLLLAIAVHLMPVISITPGKFSAPHKQINDYIFPDVYEINDCLLSIKW
jgi:hypothetical protein